MDEEVLQIISTFFDVRGLTNYIMSCDENPNYPALCIPINWEFLPSPPPSDGMRCCRSDWLGLCLFVVINSRVLSANRILGFFFVS